MKSLSRPTATEHKEPLCNILTCCGLLYSWIFIWKTEPHSGFLSRVGHWLYDFVWSWSSLACSFDPEKLEGLRGILGAVKHFRVSNFPFYIKPSSKICTLPSLPLQNIDVMSTSNSPVLSSALDLWHQLNPCQKPFSGHALFLLFQLGKLRPKLVSGTVGLCSGTQRILFTLWCLLNGKCYFSAHKILKTLKFVGKAHVTLTGVLFLFMCCLRHLPCWWPESKS